MVSISSCSSALTADEMRTYLQEEDNGLLVKKQVNGIDFSVMYQPSQLHAIRDAKTEEELTKYDEYLYFVLSLSANGVELLNQVGSRSKFSEMVSTLSFGMQQKVRLVTSEGNELPFMDSHHARTYGQANSNQIMLIFKKENLEEAEWLKLQLSDLGFKTGDLSFKFDTNDILNIPDLVI